MRKLNNEGHPDGKGDDMMCGEWALRWTDVESIEVKVSQFIPSRPSRREAAHLDNDWFFPMNSKTFVEMHASSRVLIYVVAGVAKTVKRP